VQVVVALVVLYGLDKRPDVIRFNLGIFNSAFQNFNEKKFMQRSAAKKIKNSTNGNGHSKYPEPGSKQEKQVFKKLQNRLRSHFDVVFSDRRAPCTVVVIPSLSMDQEILSKISGINHYEERLLCMLLLLRMPRTNVIYVTSETIDPVTIMMMFIISICSIVM
jgi:hypothetical protein